MECKFCHAPLKEQERFCSACGRDQQEKYTEEAVAAEAGELKPGWNTPVWLMWLVPVLAVALIALAAFLLWPKNEEKSSPSLAEGGAAVDIRGADDFTVENGDLDAQLGTTVIAKVLDENGKVVGRLTNAELGLRYWDSFMMFYENYYYMIYQTGLDITNLDATEFDKDEEDNSQSWQEFFLSEALNTFRQQAAICAMARQDGFVMPEDMQTVLEENKTMFRGMEDVQEQLYAIYGPNVDLELFLAYLEEQYYYSSYLSQIQSAITYTDEDLSKFYDDNASLYSNLPKSEKPNVDVRHILIEPAETGTDEDWEVAQQQAQEIYNTWLAGEKTEDSFAALAKEHSADGNAAQGGIYNDVYPGQMVEAFENWCFDETRQPGDSGIVETPFGYHIMYFVAHTENYYWKTVMASEYTNAMMIDQIALMTQDYALAYDLDKIALGTPGQFAAEEETAS